MCDVLVMLVLEKQIIKIGLSSAILDGSLPVIIVSCPRVGSTILGFEVTEQLVLAGRQFRYFIEPLGTVEKQEFLAMVDADVTSEYVLKVHGRDIIHYPDKIKNIIRLHQCFLIRIRRRNVVDQIVSSYIENIRRVWLYTHYNEIVYDPIPISDIKIQQAIQRVLANNKGLDSFDASFDLDLYYEDLQFTSIRSIKTPKPDNFIALREAIAMKLAVLT